MSGQVAIVGLGPGRETLVTPDVRAVIDAATDVIGYIPYVKRIAPRAGLTLHASDNRVEIDRATHALRLAERNESPSALGSRTPVPLRSTDLDLARQSGLIEGTEIVEALVACMGCSDAGDCKSRLDRELPGLPDYCRNASLISRVEALTH